MPLSIDSKSIDSALKKLAGQNDKILKKGLKTAGNVIAERLKQNSPYDGRTKLHLKDHVAVSTIKDDYHIEIGYDKEVEWRAKFVEFGTIKQKPQHFIQDTQRETSDDAMKILIAELKKGLKL